MRKYSVFAVAREAMRGHRGWEAQWTSPEPRKEYDVIIIGAGGHGLGTAYYLAKEHGITNIAVLEKGWLGGGNTGRNTTIIRSNYLYDESAGIYDHALKLWDGLSQDLNYNVMYSARGVMMLSHNIHDQQVFKRHIHANRLNGIDNEWLTPEQAQEFCPPLDISRNARYPILGAALQRRGGTARHDAVAWGYARAAADRGVHIIQNCEVTGIRRAPDRFRRRRRYHARLHQCQEGRRRCCRSYLGVMEMAGVRMPLVSYPLQALVSEPIKPIFPCVVMSNTVHAYISQSDKGELVIGAGTDQYSSYSQTGGLQIINHTLDAICELFPIFRRMKMLRSWGGIVDVTPDRSPILAKTPVPGLYVNCGWGTGGFKATPGSGQCLCPHHRQGRAAQDQRAVHHRALPLGPPDRRSGRGRRGALRGKHHASDLLPLLRGRAFRARIPPGWRRAYRPPGRT
jgi:sarcosine oxidase subunit beta